MHEEHSEMIASKAGPEVQKIALAQHEGAQQFVSLGPSKLDCCRFEGRAHTNPVDCHFTAISVGISERNDQIGLDINTIL